MKESWVGLLGILPLDLELGIDFDNNLRVQFADGNVSAIDLQNNILHV
jgi:hypothetical protein